MRRGCAPPAPLPPPTQRVLTTLQGPDHARLHTPHQGSGRGVQSRAAARPVAQPTTTARLSLHGGGLRTHDPRTMRVPPSEPPPRGAAVAAVAGPPSQTGGSQASYHMSWRARDAGAALINPPPAGPCTDRQYAQICMSMHICCTALPRHSNPLCGWQWFQPLVVGPKVTPAARPLHLLAHATARQSQKPDPDARPPSLPCARPPRPPGGGSLGGNDDGGAADGGSGRRWRR